MNEASKLKTDFLIVDECSMLDISLTASLLKAVPLDCQVLFIGNCPLSEQAMSLNMWILSN